MDNHAKYANWIAIGAAVISVAGSAISIRSCSIAEKTLTEASQPRIMFELTDDAVVISNEGKGVASIIKTAYSSKDGFDPKCMKKIKDEDKILNDEKADYEVVYFQKGDFLRSGGEKNILICEDCDVSYHKEYNYFIAYEDFQGKRYHRSSKDGNLTVKELNKIDLLDCNK